MALVVTGVSALIHLYSVALHELATAGYTRFFAYLNFFVFSMLLLVLAGNFVAADRRLGVRRRRLLPADQLLVPPQDRDHGRHQGLRDQRVGDIGLVLAAVPSSSASWARSTTARSSSRRQDAFTTQRRRRSSRSACCCWSAPSRSRPRCRSTPGCPDAMEGPTPVSALIHAATMVTAGVYLIARFHPLFELAPTAADVAAIVGRADAARSPARSRSSSTDLKRIIAYSTMSQIGYMIVGVVDRRLRRRALPPDDARLLQGAAVHGGRLGDRRDGRRPGHATGWAASARRCRSPSACFLIGALALAGFPLLSGFFSKDEILASRSTAAAPTDLRRRRLHRRAPDRLLHAARMSSGSSTASPASRGRRARGRPPRTTRDHVNPATGELEDTDVGFPGAEHHIAEREPRDEDRDGRARGACRSIAGALQIPGVSHAVEQFLEPTFEDSRYAEAEPSPAAEHDRPGHRRADRARRASRSPSGSTAARRGVHRSGCAERLPRASRLPRQQVVLRRAHRPRRSSARSRRSAASRPRVRALRGRRPRRRHRRPRAPAATS